MTLFFEGNTTGPNQEMNSKRNSSFGKPFWRVRSNEIVQLKGSICLKLLQIVPYLDRGPHLRGLPHYKQLNFGGERD